MWLSLEVWCSSCIGSDSDTAELGLGRVRLVIQQVSQVLKVSDHVRNEAGTVEGIFSETLFKW